MFFFGHLGITLGIAVLLFRLLKIKPDRKIYLAVFIGAILPDLIDKPVGEILLAGSISNGRIFAHTLLFIIFLLFIGMYLYKRNSELRGLTLCFASFLHLCEDQMWLMPETLFYPAYGFSLPQGTMEAHWWQYFISMFLNTYSFSSGVAHSFYYELIGIAILVLFFLQKLSVRRGRSQ
ncbi:MAG: LexA-binding, inner membrane-associated putativehydrolase [Candidatus Argoarchaeum ethanivorans]|uniref:LexA-binding, inner membrane-associated putativehydrolase n=1 Tax=Candidatus Argoarchaeum ethanivorans TaxID=2608793 RepID=A0A811T372_9EURY|nr:MAG: LexA-binding, inner membrane-associated putativehydrolase [Candidatus Argoarchaeum ethanivorans]